MPLSTDRADLVLSHLDLAHALMLKWLSRLPGFTRDELESAARLGLLQAAERWDGRGNFREWAIPRIRGAMLDEVRRFLGRSRERITEELPEDDRLAVRERRPTPDGILAADVAIVLRACQASLPARTWEILRLYFAEGHTHKAISEAYGVTETRIIQIVNAAIRTVRTALRID